MWTRDGIIRLILFFSRRQWKEKIGIFFRLKEWRRLSQKKILFENIGRIFSTQRRVRIRGVLKQMSICGKQFFTCWSSTILISVDARSKSKDGTVKITNPKKNFLIFPLKSQLFGRMDSFFYRRPTLKITLFARARNSHPHSHEAQRQGRDDRIEKSTSGQNTRCAMKHSLQPSEENGAFNLAKLLNNLLSHFLYKTQNKMRFGMFQINLIECRQRMT